MIYGLYLWAKKRQTYLIFSENCAIKQYKGVDYFVAIRKMINVDRKILARNMSMFFGFNISQRRLKETKAFYIKFGTPTSWINQCLCHRYI